MTDSAVLCYLQVCHLGAIPWHEPKLLASCSWWSSQLQCFPGATGPLDTAQYFSLMEIKINSPYFEGVRAISVIEQRFQAAIVSALAYSADCIWPQLQSSCLWAGEAAVHLHLLPLSFCTGFKWGGFVCIVSPGSIDFWRGLVMCVCVCCGGMCGSWVKGKAALWWSCLLPSFSGWGLS